MSKTTDYQMLTELNYLTNKNQDITAAVTGSSPCPVTRYETLCKCSCELRCTGESVCVCVCVFIRLTLSRSGWTSAT